MPTFEHDASPPAARWQTRQPSVHSRQAAFGAASVGLGYFMGYVGIMWANVIGTAAGSIVVMAAALRQRSPAPSA